VVDNGAGIGTSVASSGLVDLRRRALARHGELEVVVRAGGGTRLHWTALLGRPAGRVRVPS
jgi:signal transduction histidine kinase